jgi:hypothetical protein
MLLLLSFVVFCISGHAPKSSLSQSQEAVASSLLDLH